MNNINKGIDFCAFAKELPRKDSVSMVKAFFILGALENGWTVKKSSKLKNGFEFTSDAFHRPRQSTSEQINEFSVGKCHLHEAQISPEHNRHMVGTDTERRRCISEPLRIVN